MAIIVATWRFGELACRAGADLLAHGGSALDAVEAGASAVEADPTEQSVGVGGLPNRLGVVELDAAIMDGSRHACGAVAGVQGIAQPTKLARQVMEHSPHTMLIGEGAAQFALEQGHILQNLSTPESRAAYAAWMEKQGAAHVSHFGSASLPSHDTVGVLALDDIGNLAGACSTSGLAWKYPGRVGDSPIIGAGLYVDNEVGAATATGNGDEIIQVGLSYRIVHLMELGASPQQACEEAIRYLLRKRPNQQWDGAACIALSKLGEVGQAATADGFRNPDRLWEYAVWDGASVHLQEGDYIASPR